ncbi:MAG: hypothetical protein H2066_04420 [Candidatus Poseidoniales archaeon]|nr:hypothetical protein [Candidatus Poseidoniales archaeon]|tara:strand:- start:1411 stop:1836 length:426 start_codon:yes stop_codon:yes gene_type:complete
MSELPEWAQSMWEDLGSPELSDVESVHTGDLMDRRHGLRKDDFVEIQLDARALRDSDDTWVKGRLLSSGKSSIELLTTDGNHIYLAREVIVQVVLVAHTRPAYIDDKELLEFERADQKRRSNLHERVEKKTKGNDDSHLWG